METSAQKESFFVDRPLQELGRILAIGAVIGLITIGLSELLARFFIAPVFCSDPATFSICSSGGLWAFYIATVIGAIVATAVLAKLAIFRPLPIAAAASAALWGIKPYIDQGAWWEYSLWALVLFMVAYGLFYWIFRLQSFILSLIISLITVVIIRLVLHS